MHLLVTVLAGLLNLALAGYGLYTFTPRLVGQFNVENATSFLVVVTPFAATAIFALGARTKPVWLLAAVFNLLAMIGLIVFTKASQPGADAGALIGGLAVAGVIATANLAFLVWRTPEGPKGSSAPAKEVP